ncbi:hypothetical protein TrST_g3862 [Triparma strigata]|uniref:Dienelactone hydrolase domain-containing protein n=1 Tax=Triparma strigata TaxID=1606541 RepID=A0A9W7DW60_9STRA|nr:hypothetical protein TrST_g3862 [Triparma strigata]
MSCCPPDSLPYAEPPEGYTPTGEERILGSDLKVYVSLPSTSSTKAIIVFPEVFGWSGRLKGICDHFSSSGYIAIMPDCHRGDSALNKPDIPKWVSKTDWSPTIKCDFDLLKVYLDEKGVTSISAIGFCWGAWAWAKAASEGFEFKCAVGPHPSVKLESLAFNRSIPEMCSKVSCPVLLLAASNDQEEVKPGGEFTNSFASGNSVLFEDQLHGWMSRGDVGDPIIKAGVTKAMDLSLKFFEENA